MEIGFYPFLYDLYEPMPSETGSRLSEGCLMAARESDVQRIAKQYMKYLNGPLGQNVMAHLEEGESCIIKAQNSTLRITRREGKAVVQVIEPNVGKDYLPKT